MQGEEGTSTAAVGIDGGGEGEEELKEGELLGRKLGTLLLKVVVVGYGEISQRQHVPVIIDSSLSASSRRRRHCQFELIGIIDPIFSSNDSSNKTSDDDKLPPAPVYSNLDDFVKSQHRRDIVGDGSQSNDDVVIMVIACPPQYAQEYVQKALDMSMKGIFMEKPPGLDTQRLVELRDYATQNNITLFTGYHSIYAPEVQHAKEEWIERKRSQKNPFTKISIVWKESAKKWHGGQTWITQSNLGVLDMFINPISIVEEILGSDELDTMIIDTTRSTITKPKNWVGPISGSIAMIRNKNGREGRLGNLTIYGDFAWNYEDEDIWKITFETCNGESTMELYDGGAQMTINGVRMTQDSTHTDILRPEYEALYDKFVDLLSKKECEVRTAPLRIMNDILSNSTSTIVDEEYYL